MFLLIVNYKLLSNNIQDKLRVSEHMIRVVEVVCDLVAPDD